MPKRGKIKHHSLRHANPLMKKAHKLTSNKQRRFALPFKQIDEPKNLEEYYNRYKHLLLVQNLFQERNWEGEIKRSLADSARGTASAYDLRRHFIRLKDKEGVGTVRALRRSEAGKQVRELVLA